MKKRLAIRNVLIIGDSLTDPGAMNLKKLFGFIPMRYLSGLQGVSPDGRFTNGYNWADFLSLWLLDSFDLSSITKEATSSRDGLAEYPKDKVKDRLSSQKVEKRSFEKSFDDLHITTTKRRRAEFGSLFNECTQASSRAEISDAIITDNKKIKPYVSALPDLTSPDEVKYRHVQYTRTFAEGGLTAANSFPFTFNPKLFFSRRILSNLKSKRTAVLRDDEKNHKDVTYKEKTLVIEWAGANDLITVNPRPIKSLADSAVKARIENVEKLIKKGYRHFVLFNLPDLSLTPRFQGEKKDQINFAYLASRAFNLNLQRKVVELNQKHAGCTIDIFDIDALFSKIYKEPESYGFDKEKLKKPFLDNIDDPINDDGRSPATGYMFWDDVHPTADTQAYLARELIKTFHSTFEFISPLDVMPFAVPFGPKPKSQEDYLNEFKDIYADFLDRDYKRWRGSFARSELPYLAEISLAEIVSHGLHESNRTKKCMVALGWINEEGQLVDRSSIMRQAFEASTGQDPKNEGLLTQTP